LQPRQRARDCVKLTLLAMPQGATTEPPAAFFSREFLLRHIADIVAFYESRVKDEKGGFHQSFMADGTRFNEGFKQIVSSTRMVINFMLAGHVLGRQDLLELGAHGLRYVKERHYVADKAAYAFTMQDHEPADMTQQAYGYAFILAAHAAARRAGVTQSDDDIRQVFDLMEERFWLKEDGAYADTISANGEMSDYRGQNSNMHACEAMIAAYEATQDQRYLQRAEVLADTFTRRLAAKADGLVCEHYTKAWEPDWEYNKDDPKNIYRPWGIQPGHQIEWSKNLLNIYRYRQDCDWMKTRACELFDAAWKASWDDAHGGLIYGFDQDRKWTDDDKYFWVQGESIASAALLHHATGDQKYKQHYEDLWKYSWENFVDHEHGAWCGFKLSRDNKKYSEEKAVAGAKCDYHTLVSCVEALRAFPAAER